MVREVGLLMSEKYPAFACSADGIALCQMQDTTYKTTGGNQMPIFLKRKPPERCCPPKTVFSYYDEQ